MAAKMESGLLAVQHRNEFYRDQFRNMTKIAFVLSALLLGSVALNFVQFTNRAEPRYFATTSDGKVLPLIPLNEPSMPTEAILAWAGAAASKVYSFDFKNYASQLQASSPNFTVDGWNEFLRVLQEKGLIEFVKTKRLVVSAAPESSGVVLNEGLVEGRYAWKVQVPVTVTYSGGTENTNQVQKLTATMVIQRVSTLTNPQGIGITQILFAAR